MEYNKIVAVTGLPGLFELINSKTDGAILRSLEDKTTRFVSSRIHQFTHLESIEVYTTGENVNLVDILHAMEKAGGQLPNDKDAGAVKKYFEKTYPDLDFERVYSSDMKKMVKWFELLNKHKIDIKLTEIPEEEEEEVVEEPVMAEETKEEKPAKKTAAKKPAAKTAKEDKKSKPAAKKKSSSTGKSAGKK